MNHPAHAEQPALAMVNGVAFTDMPADLFIPPDALAVYLHTFEGPLDLLSWLIRRHRLDILNIPMAQLTAQYMEYVGWMRQHQMDLAADYLVMAAWLLDIKSRMLLPRPPIDAVGDEEADPRAHLIRQLVEYEQIRQVAMRLDAHPQCGRDYLAVQGVKWVQGERLPQISVGDLQQTWLMLMARGKLTQHHQAARRELSVRAAMARLLNGLQGDLFMEWNAFVHIEQVQEGHDKQATKVAHWVVNLLAMLELARECQIEIVQNTAFAPIYVRWVGEGAHAA